MIYSFLEYFRSFDQYFTHIQDSKCHPPQRLTRYSEGRDPSNYIQSPGEGWSIFGTNNFEQTLHEINNLLQKLFYSNMY